MIPVFEVAKGQKIDDQKNLILLNMLKNDFGQINIIFGETLADTSNLYTLYNQLSKAIDNQIVIGKSQILNNKTSEKNI